MRLAHFRHSCILVEIGSAKILFDPGNFSHGFEGITGLDAIFVTHQHPDHCDTERLPALIAANPGASLFADPQTAAKLDWTPVHAGQVVTVKDALLTGVGGRHAVIHPDIPVIDNTGVLVGTASNPATLYHPGDSLHVPSVPVEVLALPAAAPWMRISEAVDFLRSVQPRMAIPIHQEVLADAGRAIYYTRFKEMSPEATDFTVLPEEELLAVT